MNTEQELRAALERIDDYVASPDLFARVTGTLAEDARYRARLRRLAAGALVGVVVLVGWFAVVGSIDGGRVVVPGWSLEVAVTLLLVTLVVVLGPALRRFGAAYLIGALGKQSATRFAALLDVAYFLVCAGYVLVTTSLLPDVVATPVDPEQLIRASWRIGGLALVLGALHTLTILAVPLVGLVLRSIRWRAAPGAAPQPRAHAADRVALASVIVLGVCLAAIAGIAVVLVVVVGVAP